MSTSMGGTLLCSCALHCRHRCHCRSAVRRSFTLCSHMNARRRHHRGQMCAWRISRRSTPLAGSTRGYMSSRHSWRQKRCVLPMTLMSIRVRHPVLCCVYLHDRHGMEGSCQCCALAGWPLQGPSLPEPPGRAHPPRPHSTMPHASTSHAPHFPEWIPCRRPRRRIWRRQATR